MKNWKLYLKEAGIFAGIILGMALLTSIISFFTNIGSKVVTILLLGGVILAFVGLGYWNGKRASNKGYLVGLKVGSIAVLVMLILSFIFFGFKLKLSNIIYYVVLILSSVVGAMIGINKK